MKLTNLIYLLFLFSFFQKGQSQTPILFEDSFTEETTDQQKFSIYIDSIDKYLYRDINITELALNECQKIIDRQVPISDSVQFNYVLAKIYFKYSKADPLGAFQIIMDHKDIIDGEGISKSQIGNLNYLKSFTYMSIGDLEAAQQAYYKEIEIGKVNKDTAIIVRSLYSLGQLYNDEKNIEASIECFNQIISYHKVSEIRPSTMALVYIELSESYSHAKDYDKALESLQTATKIAEEHQLDILKSDILFLESQIYLFQNQPKSAEKVYKQLNAIALNTKDQNNTSNIQVLSAEIFRAKKQYPEALKAYEELIQATDSTNLNVFIETYTNLHEVCLEMKNFKAAYNYLLQYNKVKDKKDQDVKRQKTAYLKIKYDYGQKEKENAILAARVNQNQAERKLLYGGIGLVLLFLMALFYAFFQKSRYSKKLEYKVLKRTTNLKKSNDLLNKSNQELDEFNRILYHDLKEPLRSIVGFSQLAKRDILQPSKAEEYLDFVTKSGQQLGRLIDDVGDYRMINSIKSEKAIAINFMTLFNDILWQVKEKHPDKRIELEYNPNHTVIGSMAILRPIFRNIIDNATKYNLQQTVSIKITDQKRNQNHYFEIEDNGVGIPQEYHTKIFEMFKKLNSSDTFRGSGLGLSIAQKLLEKINGKISVLSSQENKGSIFLISFPEVMEHEYIIPSIEMEPLKKDELVL